MKKAQIAKQLARRTGVSEAQAADRLDHVVRQILGQLRRRRQAPLPGLGRLLLDADGKMKFEGEEGKQ